ncbi:hypothetical protein M3664_04700 [Paenibacillus lautus]|uniref:hypothetical protein n=1 Tax=Paenibacillus lautus TaxID=1401 RepID=UPI00203E2E5A|nr:hypothetical protein [Paenibacillus lautus]MCM3257081.1 hypothetical protein [Paenibacillus lautus]
MENRYDPEADTTRIVNEHGVEINPSTLGFVGGEINDYINRKEEELLGEKRKKPLDEFTIRRNGIEDYVLIEGGLKTKTFLEAYHDKNALFFLESFTVSSSNNLRYNEFDACLTVEEAEKILYSLQRFVNKNKNQ